MTYRGRLEFSKTLERVRKSLRLRYSSTDDWRGYFVDDYRVDLYATAHATEPGATIVRYEFAVFPRSTGWRVPACCYDTGRSTGYYLYSLYKDTGFITEDSLGEPLDGNVLVTVTDSYGSKTTKMGNFTQ